MLALIPIDLLMAVVPILARQLLVKPGIEHTVGSETERLSPPRHLAHDARLPDVSADAIFDFSYKNKLSPRPQTQYEDEQRLNNILHKLILKRKNTLERRKENTATSH